MRATTLSWFLGATIAALVCTGCSSGTTSANHSTSSVAVTSTVDSTTKAPATTIAVEPTSGAPTSAEAVDALVGAWRAHDRVAASRIATAEAVAGIFATPDPDMWLRGCTTDDALPQGGCVYRTRAGLVQINTEHRSIGWVVTSAYYDANADGGLPPDPGNAPDAPPPTTSAPSTTSTTMRR